jgi:tRNA (cmo5U34)-methyltransferase
MAASDLVGDGIRASRGQWSFGGEVCDVFENHIRRSVPLYDELHRLIAYLATVLVPPGGVILDLGCSTGTLLRRILRRHPTARATGVDREHNMIAAAMRRSQGRGTYICEDVRTCSMGPSQLTVCLYTLQFLPIQDRLPVLQRAAAGLGEAGAFVLAEKVRRRDAELQRLCTAAHHDFKRCQGFSEAEIAAKDRSLEGVLTPLLDQENVDLLRQAGFMRVELLLRHSCFDSWLARP